MKARRGMSRVDVVAVVAVLGGAAGLIVPTLARARQSSRGQVSVANLLQINAAGGRYMGDYGGTLPITMTWTPRYYPAAVQQNPAPNLVCSWSFGGKNNTGWWYNSGGGAYDVEAADRPLNSYLYAGAIFAPPVPVRLAAADPARRNFQLPVFRDPANVVSHQRDWPRPNSSDPRVPNYDTAYDDVGTDYLFNSLWLEDTSLGGTVSERFRRMATLIANRQRLTPSRFVWVGEQVMDVVPFGWTSASYRNSFGEVNTGAMAFLDGSVGYGRVFPANTAGGLAKWNPKYQLWFDPPTPVRGTRVGGGGSVGPIVADH